MDGPSHAPDDPRAVRRLVAHELYGKLAFLSFVIWTTGTILLFISFAAGSPRPFPMAAMSMTLPLIPAALPWLFYRQLTNLLTAMRMQSQAPEVTTMPSSEPRA
jgi:hypothetical protein